MKKKPITILDIGEELNISASTVSRALADSSLVNSETKKKVVELAKKYNYQPNFTALSLQSNSTKTIGVLIPNVLHEFFGLVLRGVEDHCHSSGYSCIVYPTNEDPDREISGIKALMTGRVDGVLLSFRGKTNLHIKQLIERNIPLVFFDTADESFATHRVLIDDKKAGYLATKHLIEVGSKKIGFIGGSENINNQLRLEGYKQAVSEAGITIDPQLIVYSLDKSQDEMGLEDSEKLLSVKGIDGIFATTDMFAVGVLKNLKKINLKCPEDIAVIGFSNWAISRVYEPSLSTVEQPGYEMGIKAAELLIDQIKNPETPSDFKTVLIPTEVIVRTSTARGNNVAHST